MPASFMKATTSAEASEALNSRCNLSTMAIGVPLGANSPIHT